MRVGNLQIAPSLIFNTALRKYSNTHSVYSVDDFCMCKDDLLYTLNYVYSIVHCKNCTYLCFYDLLHILLLWNTYGSQECMCMKELSSQHFPPKGIWKTEYLLIHLYIQSGWWLKPTQNMWPVQSNVTSICC